MFAAALSTAPGAAQVQRTVDPRPSSARGVVVERHITSRVLGRDRRVWVYTPPHYSPNAAAHGLLVAFWKLSLPRALAEMSRP